MIAKVFLIVSDEISVSELLSMALDTSDMCTVGGCGLVDCKLQEDLIFWVLHSVLVCAPNLCM